MFDVQDWPSICNQLNKKCQLRSIQNQPSLEQAHIHPGTFAYVLHADEGEGQAEDPTLVVTWSPAWSDERITTFEKYVVAVLPGRRIIKGRTVETLFRIIVEKSMP